MKTWIKNRYASYTADGKCWLTIGIVCLIVDMAIGYMAGISQATFWHGVGAAMLAAGFAFLPDAAYEEYENRRIASAVASGNIELAQQIRDDKAGKPPDDPIPF